MEIWQTWTIRQIDRAHKTIIDRAIEKARFEAQLHGADLSGSAKGPSPGENVVNVDELSEEEWSKVARKMNRQGLTPNG